MRIRSPEMTELLKRNQKNCQCKDSKAQNNLASRSEHTHTHTHTVPIWCENLKEFSQDPQEQAKSFFLSSDEILRELWEEHLYGNFFKTFDRSLKSCLVAMSSFRCLCIVIEVGDSLILTDIAHAYEHN